jgi:hypothetical protein
MDLYDSRGFPMCLYDEGMRCKVAIGHGSDGRLRHGLRNKSTLESDENFEQNLLESQMVPGGTKNELKIDSIVFLIFLTLNQQHNIFVSSYLLQ